MAVKLPERDVQCVWLKDGQEFFIGDIAPFTYDVIRKNLKGN